MIRIGIIWSLVVLVAVAALSFYGQTMLPADAQIAVHWGPSGAPDRFAGLLFGLWFMPVLVAVMAAAFAILPAIEPRRGNLLQSSTLYLTLWVGVMLVLGIAHGFVVLTALGYDVPVAQGVIVVVGLLMAVVGNVLGKSQSNFVLGIRTPWTLSSNESWDKTHRLAGRIWVLGGLAIAAGAFFVPLPDYLYGLVAIVAVMVFVPLVASYVYWRGASDRQTGEA